MVDGKESPHYRQDIMGIRFSPDSKHIAWINTTSKGWVVFIDERMGPTYDSIIQSKAGARFVDDDTYRYYGVKDNQVYRVTIDLGA